MSSVRDPPSIPRQIELRPAKAIDRREILDLWDRRAGFGISKTVDAVLDDETAASGFVGATKWPCSTPAPSRKGGRDEGSVRC